MPGYTSFITPRGGTLRNSQNKIRGKNIVDCFLFFFLKRNLYTLVMPYRHASISLETEKWLEECFINNHNNKLLFFLFAFKIILQGIQ